MPNSAAPSWIRTPLARKCLILPQNHGLLPLFRKMRAVPKGPQRTRIIPKNRTGSGRSEGTHETNKWELDAPLLP
jgi:hypothetical protein